MFYSLIYLILRTIVIILVISRTFRRVFSALPDSQNAVLSAERVLQVVSRQPTIDVSCDVGIVPVSYKLSFKKSNISCFFFTQDETKGDIKLQKVRFTYPSRPGVTILKSFNISIKSGQTLALVGPSGSGKSTIISLTERFYDPAAGSILLDGVDLRDLNISWLRRQISLVSQEPVLFNMSIADNIRYGANFREISDEEIMEAAKSANIHEFIQTLPEVRNTYNSFIMLIALYYRVIVLMLV